MKDPDFLRTKSNGELEEMRKAELAKAAHPDLALQTRGDAGELAERIVIEQERRANRTMLRIAVLGLAVTALTGFGTLLLELVKLLDP